MTNKFIILSLIALILAVAGCQIPVEPEQGTYKQYQIDLKSDIKTNQFTSEKELINFIKENSEQRSYLGRGLSGFGDMIEMEEAVVSVAPKAAPQAGDDGSIDYSETNIQVKGVDEADIIKTDGNYIYTVSGLTLFIIKAYPGEDAELISTIKFENRPDSIFIKENKLAVFGSFNNNDYFKKFSFVPRQGMTFLDIYDISDKEDPEKVKDYKFEGNYFRGRMIDEYMYILTSTYPQHISPMPIIFEGNVKTTIAVEDIHYFNIPYDDLSFVNIHAINIDNNELSSKAVAVESSQNLYMSQDNIYITYTEYIRDFEIEREITIDIIEPKLTTADKELIEKIKKTDNDVLSRSEKENKIFQVYEQAAAILPLEEQEDLQDKIKDRLKQKLEEIEHFEFTVINKININKDVIKPIANGKVPGHISNQFSLDEKDAVLRIATTVNARWNRFEGETKKSVNNIYTLDKNLEILDELEGLAEGERIFSTRFIDDRLYMVTFKQVDPFFVIDLSNPKNIKELGELKIPGFSRYLHPYDKDTIIGIGQDATESGRTKGLKISLFDVSDVENPEEIAKYVTESRYASSSALYEHKAFLFSKDKELLVIPAYNYNYEDNSKNYNGAFVFKITKDSIKLRGLIDHSDKSESRYQAAVERSLYIKELLYTKSKSLLRINNIEDLEKIKNIELEYKNPNIPIY